MLVTELGTCWTVLVLIAISLPNIANGQMSGSFSIALHGPVWALAIQPDRKILLGGLSIDSLAGHSSENLGRLNSDGTFDFSFHPGAASDVTSLAVQADGRILVGGALTNLAGQISTNLARLNVDGTGDDSFASPDPNNIVWALCVQPDGKILLAGPFTRLAGVARAYLARINSDGSLDNNFAPVLDGNPVALALQQDGKILLGGSFTLLNGYRRNGLARLNADGTLDLSFNAAVGGFPWSMALERSGKLLVSFIEPVGGLTNASTVRLNSNGSLDTNFSSRLAGPVNSFGIQADGKILTLFGGGLARLNDDGSLDDSFTSGTNSGGVSLAVQSDGAFVVASTSIEGRSNIEQSLSVLTYQDTTAAWSLGGTTPDVTPAVFDYTTNGINWVSLGEGTPTLGGWKLSGVVLPSWATLRARGGVTGGYFNGSFWFAESFFGRPAILWQPASITNYTGAFSQLYINAGGSEPMAYQWFKDGVEISGATNNTLIFSSLRSSDIGGYSILVTNQFGSATSTVAAVSVLSLPEIITNDGRLGFTNSQFGFSIKGKSGQAFVVEWTATFVNWNPVLTNVLAGGSFSFSEPYLAKFPRRFYRVRVLQ